MTQTQTTTEDNLETLSLVWLDGSVNTSKENLGAQARLRSSINYLKTFEDDQQCEQFIRSVSPLDRIVLIVSGRLGQQLVPRIHQLRQIFSIYVYCADKQRNKQWTQHYSKIRDVIVELDELIAQLLRDQSKRQHSEVDESLVFTIFNPNVSEEQSTSGMNGQFVHSQLLIDCLQRMKSTSADRKELISLCEQQYKGNSMELKLIQEFDEDYSSDRSLWWYTRESFVYRMLNKALRAQNTHLLFLFRFLIRDLGEQLEQHQFSSPVTLYRSQLMGKDELERLKQSKGELISINSFLSTSFNRHVALQFLLESTDLERVLFEIDADPRLPGVKPFANITSLSFFPQEEEVLLMLGSIFRILNINRDQNRVWIIQLKLSTDQDHDLKRVFDWIKNENGQGETDLFTFGNVLRGMGKFDEAEKSYRRRLNQLSSDDHRNIALCYYQLGLVSQDKGDYESSLQWLNRSLEIYMRILEPDDPQIAHTHNWIAIVYQGKGDLDRAFKSFNKALIIFRRAFGDDDLMVAMCFNNMGVVCFDENKYSEALDYYQKALIIRQNHLPVNHPHLGTSHNNIGNVHRRLGHSDLSLEHFNLSLEIKKKSLPPQHPEIAMTLYNIGIVYEEKKGDLKAALAFYEKAAAIFRHTLPNTHPYVIQVEQDINRVLIKLK